MVVVLLQAKLKEETGKDCDLFALLYHVVVVVVVAVVVVVVVVAVAVAVVVVTLNEVGRNQCYYRL